MVSESESIRGCLTASQFSAYGHILKRSVLNGLPEGEFVDCCLGYSVVNSGLALCSCYGNLLIDFLHLRKLFLVNAILYFCIQNSLYDIYDTFI